MIFGKAGFVFILFTSAPQTMFTSLINRTNRIQNTYLNNYYGHILGKVRLKGM